jgi:hypothetical protein
VTEALEYAVLGAHPAPGTGSVTADRSSPARADAIAADSPETEAWFDAVDLALRISDGRIVAFGIRCAGYVMSTAVAIRMWGGYEPFAVTLDLGAVHHWDFNEVMWIGPSPWACVVWSNAECLRFRSLDVLFADGRRDRLLAGPDGRGLPALDDVGRSLPSDAAFHRVNPSPLHGQATIPSVDDLA